MNEVKAIQKFVAEHVQDCHAIANEIYAKQKRLSIPEIGERWWRFLVQCDDIDFPIKDRFLMDFIKHEIRGAR